MNLCKSNLTTGGLLNRQIMSIFRDKLDVETNNEDLIVQLHVTRYIVVYPLNV